MTCPPLRIERQPLGSGWTETWTLNVPATRNALSDELVRMRHHDLGRIALACNRHARRSSNADTGSVAIAASTSPLSSTYSYPPLTGRFQAHWFVQQPTSRS